MKPVTNEVLVQQLRWRYATKQFDPARKIPVADWKALEDSMVLSASSFGLQPWRFVVITNQQIKERLVAASWNQRQLADGSHVVVFCIRMNLSESDVDRHLDCICRVRGVTRESLLGFRKVVVGFLNQPAETFDVNDWSARQVYLALGNFMTSAALLGIDTCPMEGIVPAQYDEILGLRKQGYSTVVTCVAGYRATHDKYATTPKVRFPNAEVIQHVE